MTYHQRPTRTNGINKQGMSAVERMNVSTRSAVAVLDRSPATCLHGSRNFERQFVKVFLPLVELNLAFVHQTKQIPVGADVVETVVMYANVAHVRSHHGKGIFTTVFQKVGFARGVKL